MTTPVGYEDYARLSQQGGKKLYFTANSSPPHNSFLFRGYVGSWPYSTVQIRHNAATEAVQWWLEYYSDSTFATVVGFRTLIRADSDVSATQYRNLSEWMGFFYETNSGTDAPVQVVSLYADTGPGDQFSLASMNAPIFNLSGHISAGTLNTFKVGIIQPGNAQLMMLTGAASWFVNVQYLDYATNTYLTMMQLSNVAYPNKQFIVDMPMIDAPMQLQYNNGDGVSQNFISAWVSK